MKALGKKVWLVPDCYYPEISVEGPYISHEAICVLNTSDEDAEIKLTLYFEHDEPDFGFASKCSARRTHHIRLDMITDKDGNHIPKGKPYALLVESSVPVVCQYSRLDTTQPQMSLTTTIAHALED